MTPNDVKRVSLLRAATDSGLIDPIYGPSIFDHEQMEIDSKYTALLPTPHKLTDWPIWSLDAIQPMDESRGQLEINWAQNEGQMIEIARFPVPWGMYGMVNNIDQAVQRTGALGSYLSEIDNQGRIFAERTYGTMYLRWHLRLTEIGPQSPNDSWRNPDNLPGRPYPYLGTWDDMRYLWGLPEKVHFPVPGGTVLRMYFSLVNNGSQGGSTGSVVGRLGGYIQQENSEAAQWMTKREW